jgi:hypothetical protein
VKRKISNGFICRRSELPIEELCNIIPSMILSLTLGLVVVFMIGCAFRCQAKADFHKINEWRASYGLDTIEAFK